MATFPSNFPIITLNFFNWLTASERIPFLRGFQRSDSRLDYKLIITSTICSWFVEIALLIVPFCLKTDAWAGIIK
jgi:hypothetical protein